MKAILILVALSIAGTGCSATRWSGASPGGTAKITAVAAEDTWGNLLRQLAGDRVEVSSIIADPGVDPHDYEAKPSDSVAVADASLVVVNGLGYDGWASQLVEANPSSHRVVVDVGRVVGAKQGDNPHRWYMPGDVHRVVAELVTALARVDPSDSAYFDAQAARLESQGLRGYDDQVARIRAAHGGAPIAVSESIYTGMADALGLRVLTPPSFSDAVAEGREPTARDKEAVDRLITGHQVKVFVYNSQNATPDIRALSEAAEKAGIGVVAVTETLTPPGASFQDWQQRQLTQLENALAKETGPAERAGPERPSEGGGGR